VRDRSFLDTNVLVYADDLDAGARRVRARQILQEVLETRSGALSTQVLQEFFVVSTRKLGVAPDAARRKIELLSLLDVVRPQVIDLLAAVDLHRLHGISFWDGLIVRAAQVAGCRVLLTEDLQHGRRYDGVRVENPFRAA
jgi:predicted nucleic acid-binding protein